MLVGQDIDRESAAFVIARLAPRFHGDELEAALAAQQVLASLDGFSPATRAWFRGAFAAPTAAQEGAWAAAQAGRHALVVAPTGSGKTLAAFLWALDRLAAHAGLWLRRSPGCGAGGHASGPPIAGRSVSVTSRLPPQQPV